MRRLSCRRIRGAFGPKLRRNRVLASGSLRTNAYRYVFASAGLTAKSNVADEVVPSNAPSLKEQCKRIIRYSPAAAGQPEAGISLQLSFVDGPAAPVLIGLSAQFAHAAEPKAFLVCSYAHLTATVNCLSTDNCLFTWL